MKNIPTKKILILILNTIFPICIGGLIYIIWRDQSLLMFKWFEVMNIDKFVHLIRNHISVMYTPPNWFIYSLPDGLWLYSVTYFYVSIWYRKNTNIMYFWFYIGPLIGIGSEIMQLFHILPGTFTVIDLLFLTFASIMPFYIKHERWVLS